MKCRNYCDWCEGWTLHETETGICCKCEYDEGDILVNKPKEDKR